MYISGDIGEAVFNLTWKAHIDSFNDLNIGYFVSKMAAGEKTTWDDETAVKILEEQKKERLDDSEYYFENDKEKEEFKEFIEELEGAARESRTTEQWAWQYVNGEYESDISKYDADYWEWIYDIGNVVPYHTYGFLIGLQMASEQLKEHEKISEMKNYSKACDQMENCEVCVKTMKDADTPCTCMRKKYRESIWDYKESEVEQ